MKYKIAIVLFLLYVWSPRTVCAQAVLYSPFVTNSPLTRFEVIGKAGNFYWIHKSKKNGSYRKSTAPAARDKDRSFEIYDARLNRIKEISYTISDTVVKQYFIAGTHYFDQLLFNGGSDKTTVVLNRYTPEGAVLSYKETLHDFPETMKANDFLLIRSHDKTKMLLLGFEPVAGAPPRVHAVLYNSNWKVLFQTVYKEGTLAQPFLQYDFINYPLEHFDNSPVKLADNGDWVMIAPSRRSNTYLLCHFRHADSTFIQHESRLPQGPDVQNASVSLADDAEEAFAGVLLHTGSSSHKKVQVAHYSLAEGRFDFDTIYRFNPFATGKTKEGNLTEHDFIPLPGRGFLFLKEYGRPYVSLSLPEERPRSNEEPDYAVSNQAPAPFIKNEYTRYNNLFGGRREYDRGDLSLYYFPATRRDSCWSGLLNKAQTTELNSSFLSYACMPLKGKIFFLYNPVSHHYTEPGSTTVLDQKGHSLNEGIVFWKPGNILDFQRARQTATNELAIPYEKARLQGFAVIRL